MGLQEVRHDLATDQQQQQFWLNGSLMLAVTLSVPNGPAEICPTLRVCDLGQEASSPSASVSSSAKQVKVLVAQSCLTLCDPMDCSPPGASVHGILQARILAWVAISSSRDLPSPGIKLPSPALAGGFFTTEPPEKPHPSCGHKPNGSENEEESIQVNRPVKYSERHSLLLRCLCQ